MLTTAFHSAVASVVGKAGGLIGGVVSLFFVLVGFLFSFLPRRPSRCIRGYLSARAHFEP